jgi:hypothetical protein
MCEKLGIVISKLSVNPSLNVNCCEGGKRLVSSLANRKYVDSRVGRLLEKRRTNKLLNIKP